MFQSSKKILSLAISILSVVGYGAFVFAAAPSGGYAPGATLDPACAPGDTDCVVALSSGGSGWGLAGNSASSGNFLGTTNNQPLVIKTNSAEAMRILANGNVGIGTSSPATTFDVSGSAHLAQTLSDSYLADINIDASLGGGPYDGLIMGYHSPSYDRALTFGLVHDTGGDSVDGGLSLNDNNTGEKANFSIDEFGSSDNEGDDISVVMNNFNVNSGKGLFFSEQLRAANNPTIPYEGFSFMVGNFNSSERIFTVATGGPGNEKFSILGDGTISFGALANCSSIQTDSNGTLSCGSGGSGLIGSTGGIISNPTPGSTHETWLGVNAGAGGASTNYTVFVGEGTGSGASSASGSVFVGVGAGANATTATYSNFIGVSAGIFASSASDSNFLGRLAGRAATNASNSNFLGRSAGWTAGNASYSNFFGYQAGNLATDASNANFFGQNAGNLASNAAYSIFMGRNSGNSATNATRSIFIGDNSGNVDTVDNTQNADDYSILLGNSTSTGGYSNSIALGAYATNTSANQLMIGSGTRPIYEMDLVDGTNTCLINTTSGVNCTSDQRLKTNITDLSTTTLDTLSKVRTVTYNWISGPNRDRQIGFLAQDLMQYYPELVTTAPNGYYAVNYANMAPVLVEGIRELNLKLTDIQKVADATDKTFLNNLIAWLGSATNGIESIFAKKIRTEQLCITDANGETCLNRSQINQIMSQGASQSVSPAPISPAQPANQEGSGQGQGDPAPAQPDQGDQPAVQPADPAPVSDTVAPSGDATTQ